MDRVIKTPFYEAVTPQNARSMMFIIITPGDEGTMSDAAPGNEPPQQPPTRDSNGLVNYYECAEPGLDQLWREKLGRLLYERVVRPDLRKAGISLNEIPNKIFLAYFPAHYTLWVHKKGDPHDPRKDHYLYGSRYVKVFRSPNEFFPHLKWILEGQSMKQDGKPDCRCCWCDPSQTQGQISQYLGTYHPSKDRDGRRGGRGGKGGAPKRNSRALVSTTIPFKDYTKLNPNSTS